MLVRHNRRDEGGEKTYSESGLRLVRTVLSLVLRVSSDISSSVGGVGGGILDLVGRGSTRSTSRSDLVGFLGGGGDDAVTETSIRDFRSDKKDNELLSDLEGTVNNGSGGISSVVDDRGDVSNRSSLLNGVGNVPCGVGRFSSGFLSLVASSSSDVLRLVARLVGYFSDLVSSGGDVASNSEQKNVIQCQKKGDGETRRRRRGMEEGVLTTW